MLRDLQLFVLRHVNFRLFLLSYLLAYLQPSLSSKQCNGNNNQRGTGYTQQNNVRLQVNQNSDDGNIQTDVNRASKDIARRKQNVNVHGLSESNTISDCDAFLQLCESQLATKSHVAVNDCCVRIGKAEPGKPRCLLVQLKSEKMATQLLRSAPQLRQTDQSAGQHIHIYIYIYIYNIYMYITSQRGSAWHCYIGPLFSIGKMRFSTSRPGKTNEYFVTKLGRCDYVGKIYNSPNSMKIGCEMAPPRGGEIQRFCDFLRPPFLFLFFSVSSARPQVAILVRIARLMAQKSCSD